jgi:cytochrome c oxidase assembly protein subunit 15
MRRPAITPATYRWIALTAAILLAVIIVTGGAVRLTASGLGCSSWPNCEPGQLTPTDDLHAMIEFVNRMFTGLVSVAVIVCALGSLIRVPRRRDLTWLSVGLIAGVLAQILLGGLTVLFELKPQFVMAHFLVSLVLLTNAIVLFRRAGQADVPATLAVEPHVRMMGRLLLAVGAVVVFTGTIVTATGPHGGDKEAKRFDLYLPDVARVHGTSVVVFVLLIIGTYWLLRRTSAPTSVLQRLGVLAAVVVVQAAIGYIQWLNEIPPLLVGFHIAGATAMWAAVVSFYLGLFWRPAEGTVPTDEPSTLAVAGSA